MGKNQNVFYCPSCGAEMKMDNGSLYCAYCDRKEQVCAANSDSEDLDFATVEADAKWTESTFSAQCVSCGSKTVKLDGAPAFCAYCANQNLETPEEGYGVRPGWVAPFKLTAQEASVRLEGWIKKRFLSPFSFKKERSAGSLQGVFLPYWSFGASAGAAYTGQAGNYYQDTEINTAPSGDHSETKSRRVRKVRWRMVSGNYDKKFADIIFSDASHIDAGIIKSIEPFKLNELVKYDPKFLNGFSLERYKLGLKGTWDRAKAYMSHVLRSDITGIVKRGSDITGTVNICTHYSDISYKLMLLPLWVFTYLYKNKTYNVYINGQTGEAHGESPVSVLKIGIIALAALAAAAIAVWLL
jgi:hypothetical protein